MNKAIYIKKLNEELDGYISNCQAMQLNKVEDAGDHNVYRCRVDSFETEPEDENSKFKWIVKKIDEDRRRINNDMKRDGRKIVTNRIYWGLNRILYADYVVLDDPSGESKAYQINIKKEIKQKMINIIQIFIDRQLVYGGGRSRLVRKTRRARKTRRSRKH